MKNNAILKAGKTRPTRGTRIAGRSELVILFFNFIVYQLA
jgi:hypothetical protein